MTQINQNIREIKEKLDPCKDTKEYTERMNYLKEFIDKLDIERHNSIK